MTKEVLVSVEGIQFDVEGNEPIVLVAPGNYYLKNEKHYILYEELDEDGTKTKNTIKIGKNMVDIMRKGPASTHMVFEKGKEHLTYYDTPYGSMLMGIDTSKVAFEQVNDGKMKLEVDYALSIDGKHMSDCNIKITITGK